MIDVLLGIFFAWVTINIIKVFFFDKHTYRMNARAKNIQRKLFRRVRHWKGTPRYCSKHLNTKDLKVGQMAILDNKNCLICKKITKIEMLK